MFGRLVLTILISIISVGILSVIMTAIKLAIYKAFDFMVEKILWLEYCIYFAVLIIIVGGMTFMTGNFDTISMTKNIVIVVGAGTIFEFFYFYKKYYDYESKGKYVASLLISNVLVLIVSDVLFYFVMALLLVVLALVM